MASCSATTSHRYAVARISPKAYTGRGGPLNLAALAYATADTVGYIVGTYGGPDPATHTGKYLLALRRSPGGPWLIAADMDNSSTR